MFSWVDKVTTGTQSLVSFVWKLGFWLFAVPATLIQFLDHLNWRLVSQLIKGVSSAFQKLFSYFNRSIISTSFVPPFPVWPVIFCLNLNEVLLLLSSGKSIILPLLSKAGSST